MSVGGRCREAYLGRDQMSVIKVAGQGDIEIRSEKFDCNFVGM
jgi:hypothetical protein